MKQIATLLGAAMLCVTSVSAQSATEKTEFNPHWYLQVQAGAAYTLGEVEFGKLVSPAAALSAGYRFTPVWGLRFGLSGWQSKGAWVSPENVYQYKYLQGNVEATLDLANLFGQFKAKRTVNPYLFVGLGVNGAFDNDEANAINDSGYPLGKIWSGSKAFLAGRFGLGADLRLSDRVLFGLELNANVLPDKYNSKKAGNCDWQFNALAGFTFRLGKNYKTTALPAAAPQAVARATEPKPEPQPAETQPAPVQEAQSVAPAKVAAMREFIFFKIGSTTAVPAEKAKLNALVDYLNANPKAHAILTGYADAATGTKAINARISQSRAEGVAQALQAAGIAEDRITVASKGDTEQPFEQVSDNRVVICIAE